jgi:hypothetical protein
MLALLQNRDTRWFIIIALMMCFFPWNERASSIGLIVLALHTLIDTQWRAKLRGFTWNHLSTLAVCLWLWHVVGGLWSYDAVAVTQSIQVKACLLILPVLLGLENHWNQERRFYLTMAFVGSLLLAFFYLVVHAQLTLPASGRWQRMAFSEPLMNPGYISNYYAVGIFLLATEKRCWSSKQFKLFSITALVLLLAAVLIFIAKITLVFLLLLGGFMFLKALRARIQSTWLFGAVALPGMALLVYGVTLLPPVAKRLQETERQLAVIKPADINITNSTMSRKVAYRLESELLQQAGWLGSGTGTANHEVLKALEAGGYTQLVSAQMHVHNQFMNVGIALGWIGLLLLLAFTIGSLVYILLHNNLIELGIGILMCLNLAIEDLFEIQAGVVFFVLWVFLLTTRRKVTMA